jgi:2-dehydropantoate 2-reductase
MRPGSVVLPLQNGVDVVDLLAACVGAPRVALGAAYIPTRIAEPGVIEHLGTLAKLRFGALQAEQRPALERFAGACERARIDVELVDDMRTAMWEKFVMLVGMSSLTALTRQPIGVVRGRPETRALLREVMDEAAAVAAAEGHALGADFVERQMALLDSLPAAAKASMANDLEAGRPLELAWLAGAVARRGEGLGVATPANRFVAAALAPYAAGAPAS